MKKHILLVLLLACVNQTYAQMSLIVGIDVISAESRTWYSELFPPSVYLCDDDAGVAGVKLNFKYNLKDFGKYSVGIGVPFSIGGSSETHSNSFGSTKTSLWMYMIPVTLDFNGGIFSNQGNDVRYGFYGGLGLSYNNATGTETKTYNLRVVNSVPAGETVHSADYVPKYSSVGFYAHAGVAYRFPNIFNPDSRDLTVGFHAGKSFAGESRDYFDVGISFYDYFDKNSKKSSKKKKKKKKKRKSSKKRKKKRR